MNNPQITDRRDVAHPTNPIGGHDHIEEIGKADWVKPVDPRAVAPRAGGNDSAVAGTRSDARDDLPATSAEV